VRAELQAIDEDRGDHRVAVGAGLFHQADVAGVQVAHGRHENDAAAILQRRTQVGDGGMDLHIKRCSQNEA
jgi:acyl-coenzyme A thioesterase PaaI-like protein